MSVYGRVVHLHESKDYILRPLWDGEACASPELTWWGRGVEAFDAEGIVEGGPASTEAVAGLLDDRLHPQWAQRLRQGATLDSCRLGKRPQSFPAGVERSAVAGISGNYAPSKSLSMLMVAGDDTVANFITTTHRQAVMAALNFLQDYGDIARGHDDLIGLVGVLDQRYTSKVGNPHLSTTATVLNLAPRRDGKWVGPDTRELLRWMFPIAAYIDAYLHRALSAYPELKTSLATGQGLPSITSDAVYEGTCQRFTSDAHRRSSAARPTRIPHTDMTLPELRHRITLDTQAVPLGARAALPAWTGHHLDTALAHAADRITTHLANRSTVNTHYLISSALVGLVLAGPVDSPLDHDVRLLVQLLGQRPAFRDRIRHSTRIEREDCTGVAPTPR